MPLQVVNPTWVCYSTPFCAFTAGLMRTRPGFVIQLAICNNSSFHSVFAAKVQCVFVPSQLVSRKQGGLMILVEPISIRLKRIRFLFSKYDQKRSILGPKESKYKQTQWD